MLYQQTLSESATVQSLQKAHKALTSNDTVWLWDNSPQPQPAEVVKALQEALPATVRYQQHPENTPLAKVYNTAVASDVSYEMLIFLDQDSGFDERYLFALDNAACVHEEIALFAPLIRVKNTVVSPGHFRYFKGKYWTEPRLGKTSVANTVAIMSGLAVRKSFLQQFGLFDERFRLYGIDTNLMLRYAKKHTHFYVLDVPFTHDLSDFNEESKAMKSRRFDDFRHGSLVNAKLLPYPARWLTHLFLWYRQLKRLF